MTNILKIAIAVFLCLGMLAVTGPSAAASIKLVPGKQFSVQGKEVLQLNAKTRQSLQVLAGAGGALNFSCNGVYCSCHGDVDCNDMFTTNACGARAICIDDYCYCSRP
jgi:hypothetical protein